MKKLVIVIGVAMLTCGAFARGWHHGGCHWRCAPRVYHHHYHGGWWGRGGCNFWPSFTGGVVGGIIGGAVANTIITPRETVVVQQPTVVTQPVVVQQPVVTQPVVVQQPIVAPAQSVWVEGRYVDQVQANGSTVRVWQPGHYEQR